MYQVSKEYLTLFNAMTDIDKALKDLHQKIIFAQQLAEDIYVSGSDVEDDETRETSEIA